LPEGKWNNYGCTPTKKMIAAAPVAHVARRAPEYGVTTGGVQVNLAQVVEQKDALVQRRRDQLTRRAEKNKNITLLRGEAQEHALTASMAFIIQQACSGWHLLGQKANRFAAEWRNERNPLRNEFLCEAVKWFFQLYFVRVCAVALHKLSQNIFYLSSEKAVKMIAVYLPLLLEGTRPG